MDFKGLVVAAASQRPQWALTMLKDVWDVWLCCQSQQRSNGSMTELQVGVSADMFTRLRLHESVNLLIAYPDQICLRLPVNVSCRIKKPSLSLVAADGLGGAQEFES